MELRARTQTAWQPDASPDAEHSIRALSGGGSIMPETLRSFMEPRFGADFRDVRLHTDAPAAELARSVNAYAFTVGRDIVFNAGRYAPETPAGKHLLAHELTHVVQQAGTAHYLARQPADEPSSIEQDAQAIITLLYSKDEVAGMRDPEAVRMLDNMSMARMIAVLLVVREPGHLRIIRGSAGSYTPRVALGAETAELEGQASVEPEVLARYRKKVLDLNAEDRGAVLAASSKAAVPAEPSLPTGGLTPPQGSPHGSIPPPLLATLYFSYARRQAGLPDSDNYLANAFWGPRPATFWDALDKLQAGGALNVLLWIYSRWTATGLPWSSVYGIKQTWSGTSHGFDFDCSDRAGLSAALQRSSHFCMDDIGGLYHWFEGTTPCWREVVSGSPGLHFCTGGPAATVHIDDHQVVKGIGDFGLCSYDITGSVIDHFRDLGWW